LSRTPRGCRRDSGGANAGTDAPDIPTAHPPPAPKVPCAPNALGPVEIQDSHRSPSTSANFAILRSCSHVVRFYSPAFSAPSCTDLRQAVQCPPVPHFRTLILCGRNPMTKLILQVALFAVIALNAHAQEIQCKPPNLAAAKKLDPSSTKQPSQTADLPSVIASVEAALNCYQSNRGSNADPLPPLRSAVLELKTTTGTVRGLSMSIFIFKLGASNEKDVINDLTLTYSIKPALPRGNKNEPPQSLSDSLANGILSAASAVKASPTVAGMPIAKVTVKVEFGIKNDGNVSLNVPIQLVTLNPSFERSRNDTQSVTLTFGQGE
jgi:hypothetical protein